MAKINPCIAGLDVGTTHTRVLITDWSQDKEFLNVLGLGSALSKGIRKGVVVNIEAAAESIRQAIAEAEQMAGVQIESANVALSGSQVKSYNGRGVVAISSPDRTISSDDIRRVIEQASALSISSDREIVEVLPQEFTVDDQDGIGDPLGMLGMRLGVSVHIVTSPITAKQNIVTSANRSGIMVSDLILESLAAAESTLTEEDREYGVALVNIGGELTNLAIYQRGAVQHTTVFPLGGNHFTNDIAVGLRVSVPEAERVKRDFGCCFSPMLDSDERETIFEISSMSGRAARALSRQLLCDILQPRAEEIFAHIQDEIHRSGYGHQLSSGLVLTGGGCLLTGVLEIGEKSLDLPARLGIPKGLNGIADNLASPEYSTLVGLVLCGARQRQTSKSFENAGMFRRRSRIRDWLIDIKNIF